MTDKIMFTIETGKLLLTSSRRVFKTEGFCRATRKIASIDSFVSRTAEGIFFENPSLSQGKSYMVTSEDKLYTLFFYAAKKDDRLNDCDLVFFKFLSANESDGGVDRRLSDYLLTNPKVNMILSPSSEDAPADDLTRIYIISTDGSGVNFPLLNEEQRKIVETENANILVQGVAGSGKTNVCVEKIVYCACRGYRGRVLYTTFSRGLLTETKNRVTLFLKNIDDFVKHYESGNVIFLDDNHKKAVENKLGILFDTDDDGKIVTSLKRISAFLKEQVDYRLIEDIYAEFFESKKVANEGVFLNEYIGDRRNYRMSGALDKIKNISPEIIYKEIFGMIFGKYEPSSPSAMLSKEEYAEARKDSFSKPECDIIYSIALDYANYLEKNNLTDNNLMSRKLIEKINSPIYSVGIIDEAQDFTQVNLCLVKGICRKLFCVGDALQMINPSYFNFGYLKRIMYGDVTGVSELRHNYRSTQTIEQIAEKLGELNIRRFGTHSFVLKGESVPTTLPSAAVFVKDRDFSSALMDKRLDSITVVVSSQRKKEALRKKLGKTEILTVAEAKGLERNSIVLLDVLSDNQDKWNYLQTMTLNRKTADENSVFRYYFNLFYVGISRARQYLLVAESYLPKLFDELVDGCFERKTKDGAVAFLRDIAGKTELDDEELISRIEKFCSLEQYENARYAAERLSTDELLSSWLAHIYVHEHFLRFGKVRDAGVEYWRRGMYADAKDKFIESGDEELLPLMDACQSGGGALDVEIVKFFPLVAGNEVAENLILETVKGDLDEIMRNQKQINDNLKKRRTKI